MFIVALIVWVPVVVVSVIVVVVFFFIAWPPFVLSGSCNLAVVFVVVFVIVHAPGRQRGKEKVLTHLKENAKELDAKDLHLIALAATELGTLLINATPLRTVRA